MEMTGHLQRNLTVLFFRIRGSDQGEEMLMWDSQKMSVRLWRKDNNRRARKDA